MARIMFLLLMGIFIASVFFWAEDQFLDGELVQEAIKEDIRNDGIESSKDVVSEVEAEYVYGVFKSGSEVMVYDDLNVSDLENLLEQGYDLMVVLDGSELDQSRYNFDDTRLVQVTDYDGDFMYALKFGMKVEGGFVFSKRDFRRAYESIGENVLVFDL